MKLAVASVLLAFLSGFAKADGLYNGNELVTQCATNKSFVAGYVAGEIDKAKADYAPMMVLFLGFYDKAKHAEHTKKLESSAALIEGYCIPGGVTLGQLTDVFCK
ncbi:hypothetical protein FBZ93_111239 [Bradyrhizobium macuxiense]|uniref:HdeA/HdeB family protein n=1 Tax=Bradyrhizobium macuxiense TaxID=1755647 RepID=A0A560LIV7_9BRAD|nr:hypothetical protein [Bradyrhizobium macuxiense]TWB93200.1 hypothetical protein FBZ93_111239 [Bradyrhizobium macuxiense]